MKIVSLNEVEKTAMNMDGAVKVDKQLPIARNDGTPLVSFRVFTINPDGHTPYHTHPFEHINYIIAGRGVIVRESGEEQPVTAGDFALVLPGEKHQYKNTSSSEPLVMICAVPKEYE